MDTDMKVFYEECMRRQWNAAQSYQMSIAEAVQQMSNQGDCLIAFVLKGTMGCLRHGCTPCVCTRRQIQSLPNSKRSLHLYSFLLLLFGSDFPITDELMEALKPILEEQCPMGIMASTGRFKQAKHGACVHGGHYTAASDEELDEAIQVGLEVLSALNPEVRAILSANMSVWDRIAALCGLKSVRISNVLTQAEIDACRPVPRVRAPKTIPRHINSQGVTTPRKISRKSHRVKPRPHSDSEDSDVESYDENDEEDDDVAFGYTPRARVASRPTHGTVATRRSARRALSQPTLDTRMPSTADYEPASALAFCSPAPVPFHEDAAPDAPAVSAEMAPRTLQSSLQLSPTHVDATLMLQPSTNTDQEDQELRNMVDFDAGSVQWMDFDGVEADLVVASTDPNSMFNNQFMQEMPLELTLTVPVSAETVSISAEHQQARAHHEVSLLMPHALSTPPDMLPADAEPHNTFHDDPFGIPPEYTHDSPFAVSAPFPVSAETYLSAEHQQGPFDDTWLLSLLSGL